MRPDTFFRTYTPATAGALKANSTVRAQVIADATTLAKYNMGLATGVLYHCNE